MTVGPLCAECGEVVSGLGDVPETPNLELLGVTVTIRHGWCVPQVGRLYWLDGDE